MTKLKATAIIAMLASFSIFGQAWDGTKGKKPAPDESIKTAVYNWKTLTQDNFSVAYPTNWEVNTSGEDGTSLILFSPITSKGETFRANINLVIQDLENMDIGSQSINLKEYTEHSLIPIKNNNIKSGGKFISSDLVNIDGISHQKVLYTGVSEEGLKLKYEQYYWVQNNKAYVLTFTCQDYKFINYQSTAEKIMNSFSIL